ncbi:MAG: antibiotic biosynthesis monooxygenase [Alteraurantiacibacter sp.]
MFLVVFRSRKRPGIDRAAYDAQAEEMEILAAAQPGYLSFKSFTAEDGEVVAISEWESEAHALAWRQIASHAQAQAEGRARWYAEYTMYAASDPRIHHFVAEE